MQPKKLLLILLRTLPLALAVALVAPGQGQKAARAYVSECATCHAQKAADMTGGGGGSYEQAHAA
jgi:cytochrome c553